MKDDPITLTDLKDIASQIIASNLTVAYLLTPLDGFPDALKALPDMQQMLEFYGALSKSVRSSLDQTLDDESDH